MGSTYVEKIVNFLQTSECPGFIKADVERARRKATRSSVDNNIDDALQIVAMMLINQIGWIVAMMLINQIEFIVAMMLINQIGWIFYRQMLFSMISQMTLILMMVAQSMIGLGVRTRAMSNSF